MHSGFYAKSQCARKPPRPRLCCRVIERRNQTAPPGEINAELSETNVSCQPNRALMSTRQRHLWAIDVSRVSQRRLVLPLSIHAFHHEHPFPSACRSLTSNFVICRYTVAGENISTARAFDILRINGARWIPEIVFRLKRCSGDSDTSFLGHRCVKVYYVCLGTSWFVRVQSLTKIFRRPEFWTFRE